jgi:anti-sigma factor RsiW
MTFHDIARGCCSDLQLDQLLLNELAEPERIALRTHLAASPRCQARLDEMTMAHHSYQARPLLLPIEAPARRQPQRRWLTRASLLTTAMAASVAGVLWLQPSDDGTRIKGQAVVVDVLANGRDVFANDALSAGTSVHLEAQAGGAYVAVAQPGHWVLIDGKVGDVVLQASNDAWLLAVSCAQAPSDREAFVAAAARGDVAGCDIDRMQVRVSQP